MTTKNELPLGFDATITQPSPLTRLRIQCRRCMGRAGTDPSCKFCKGKPIQAIMLGEK